MGGGLRPALVDRYWQLLVVLLLLLSHVCMHHGCRAFQASTFPANAPKSSKQRIDTDDGSKTSTNKNPAQQRLPRMKTKTKTNPDGTSDRTFTTPQQQQPQQQLHADEWIATAQERLAGRFSFALDDWQLYAGGAICHGYNVVVSAPTGAGKTVIGEMALHWAISSTSEQQQSPPPNPKKGIYTTPLKALSNEKYRDFCAIYGRHAIGLSTGDVSINKGAQITIMTTEVYRNIAWRASMPAEPVDELADTSIVILDELHYMGLPGRGGVWEESIVTSPSAHLQIIGLSATLANGHDICAWMERVTNRPTVLVQVPDYKRPVPLRYVFASRDGLFPLFRDPDAGPGAPHGLLGLRGSGQDIALVPAPSKRSKNKGFGPVIDELSSSSSFPKGLQVNPLLVRAAEKRMEKVNRALDRSLMFRKSTVGNRGRGDEDDDDSPRRKMRSSYNSYNPPVKISQREARRERDRLLKKELRRAVPTLHALLERLRRKDLLPAICFIFSRAGCDNAARSVALSMMSSAGMDRQSVLSQEVDNAEYGVGGGADYDDDDDDEAGSKRKRQGRERSGKPKKKNKKQKGIMEDKNGRSFRESGDFVSEDLLFETMMNDVTDDLTASVLGNDDDGGSVLSPNKFPFYSGAGLLELQQVKEVASAIIAFNKRNEELAFDDDVIEQFLLGLGSHHAGMLPAHKSFVEVLYQRQLMKIVFATETLAAGINMPARTTVILAMAKRGDASSMSPLETSNLLQMAGRAGRRGKDLEGTCVIVATPFESHDDAAKILTDPIKPITSQFSPSYSLCVNLIARGSGQLNVAKQLVSQSFAMWEKENSREAEEDTLSKKTVFLDVVAAFLRKQQHGDPDLLSAAEVLEDRSKTLKRASKSLIGSTNALGLEKATLSYLEIEYETAAGNNLESSIQEHPELELLFPANNPDISDQIAQQQERIKQAINEVEVHPFTIAAAAVNAAIREGGTVGSCLSLALEEARERTGVFEGVPLDGLELTTFAKAAFIDQQKSEKKCNKNLDEDAASAASTTNVDSWDEFMALTKTLVEYGCLQPKNRDIGDVEDMENQYGVTVAGEQVGLLGADNPLWNLVAMGGAWEVAPARNSRSNDIETEGPSQAIAREMVQNLIAMTPSQLAGYVSCLVPMRDGGRGASGATMIQQFQMLEFPQQEAIRKAFAVSDRLSERQTANGVSDSVICPIDIAYCAVVTAWANGCSWSEALELSGLAPGDLARTLSRVLDALRQIANLPYDPLRRSDVEITSQFGLAPRGFDPRLKDSCKRASAAINRYPLKDSLMFDQEDKEATEEEEEDVDEELENDEGPE